MNKKGWFETTAPGRSNIRNGRRVLNPTIEAAAEQSGVSAKQIFDWLNQFHFREELEKRKNDGVNQAVNRLKQTGSMCLLKLILILTQKHYLIFYKL